MWNDNNNTSQSKEVSISSSPSKSSSSSSSTCSSPIQTAPRAGNSIEELWNDISLSSLHRHHTTTTTVAATTSASRRAFQAIILQDFLTGSPFNKDPSRKEGSHEHSSAGGGGAAVLGSDAPPPATSLTLNSGPEFHYLENTDPIIMPNPHHELQSHSVFPSFCEKRNQGNEGIDSSDRRHKRMIKNRESAARSRARKQAYTNELENEIAHLVEENAKLRRQLEKACVAAPAHLPKKHTLHRTLTAPF